RPVARDSQVGAVLADAAGAPGAVHRPGPLPAQVLARLKAGRAAGSPGAAAAAAGRPGLQALRLSASSRILPSGSGRRDESGGSSPISDSVARDIMWALTGAVRNRNTMISNSRGCRPVP